MKKIVAELEGLLARLKGEVEAMGHGSAGAAPAAPAAPAVAAAEPAPAVAEEPAPAATVG